MRARVVFQLFLNAYVAEPKPGKRVRLSGYTSCARHFILDRQAITALKLLQLLSLQIGLFLSTYW